MSDLVMVQPFRPASSQGQQINGGTGRSPYATVALSVTASATAATAIQPNPETSGRVRARSVRVANSGTVVVFVEFGDNGVVATVPAAGGANGSVPVLPGTAVVFDGVDAPFVSVIGAAAGPSLVYVTAGEGNS